MVKKGLYLECYAGLDGETLVASLLDLGVDENLLKSAIRNIGWDYFEIENGRNTNNGISSSWFNIIKSSSATIVNRSSEYNQIKDVSRIITSMEISDKAKEIAMNAVDAIIKAEARVSGINVSEVKIDALLPKDEMLIILAAAICIDQLKVDEIIISEIHEGVGVARDKNGVFPIPSPLVANIISGNPLSIKFIDSKEEMLTPVGIALVSVLSTSERMPESFRIKKIGVGTSKSAVNKYMRAFLIEEDVALIKNETWILETNIDDTTGESLAFTMEKLLEGGARDVFFTPIFMKKNRPAYKLSVTCRGDSVKKMESIIFINTTTIGIKKFKIEKTVLDYTMVNVDTIFGPVKVKICSFDGIEYYSPEFEDIKSICKITGKGYKYISDEVDMAISDYRRELKKL